MITEVKSEFFTMKGLLISLMHLIFMCGLLGMYIFGRVQLSGQDVDISTPTMKASKR